MDSHALALSFGQRRWLLLPDRPAWWAARRSLETTGAGRGFGGRGFGGRAADGLWLGFPPSRRDRTLVQRQAPPRVWLSGEAPAPSLPRGWQASGASGFLMARGG
jgi:hypothetical protein